MLFAIALAVLFAHGCGDSSDDSSTSFTLAPLTSSGVTPTASTTTVPTTTITTTTRLVPATTTVPSTTRTRATDTTAQGFFEAWVANDAAKLAANGEAAAIAQATGLASSRSQPWNFDRCEGTAGSVYCSWIDSGQRLIIRVRNVEPPPRAVIEMRVEAV